MQPMSTSYETVSTDEMLRSSKKSTRAAVSVTCALLIIFAIVLGVLFGVGTLSLPSNTNNNTNSISGSTISSSSSSTGNAAALVFPPVIIDLSLTGNFSTINIDSFTLQFILDVSLLLQINSSRIIVLGLTPGSIHVQFEIKPLGTLNQTILDDPNRLAFHFIHRLIVQDYNTTDPTILFNKYPFNLTSGYTISELTTPTTTTITGNEIITGDLTVKGDFFIGSEKIRNGINGTDGRDGKDGLNSTVPGPQGPPGNNGLDSTVPGPQGPPGINGLNSTVPGPQGPAGGEPGKNGTNGKDGKDGLNSTVPGPPGPPGFNGTNGRDGRDGKDGLNSTVPGAQGPSGFNGTNGKDGKDGLNSTVPGPPGINGFNSTVPGPQGPPGFNGTNGINGINGTNGAANIPTTTIAYQVLQSTTTSGTVAWSNAIYPANTTINQLLYSNSTNNVTGLPTLANASLLTDSNGAPGWVAYTGTGKPVLQTNPTLIAPILGAATGTSLTLSTPLAVTSGGTGLSSIAALQILYSSSTNVLTPLSTNSNAMLVSDASGNPSFQPLLIHHVSLFNTVGSGTFTTPNSVTFTLSTVVKVTLVGGGAAGSTSSFGGSAGGTGIWKGNGFLPNTGYAYTVGSGGVHGISLPGTSSTVALSGGASLTATGAATPGASSPGVGCSNSGVTTADLICVVGTTAGNFLTGVAGDGGSTPFGQGGRGGNSGSGTGGSTGLSVNVGESGRGYGSGGGGGISGSAAGDGAGGLVMFEWVS